MDHLGSDLMDHHQNLSEDHSFSIHEIVLFRDDDKDNVGQTSSDAENPQLIHHQILAPIPLCSTHALIPPPSSGVTVIPNPKPNDNSSCAGIGVGIDGGSCHYWCCQLASELAGALFFRISRPPIPAYRKHGIDTVDGGFKIELGTVDGSSRLTLQGINTIHGGSMTRLEGLFLMKNMKEGFYKQARDVHNKTTNSVHYFLVGLILSPLNFYRTVRTSSEWYTGEMDRSKEMLKTASEDAKHAKDEQREHKEELDNVKKELAIWKEHIEQKLAFLHEKIDNASTPTAAATPPPPTPPKVL